MELTQLLAVARGEAPADVILANGRVVNTFSGEVEKADVALWGGYIAGVGQYRLAEEMIDLDGRYLAPGLINGHIHLESSMLDISQYARAVVPRGVLAIVTDLHEIANVAGLEGIRYVLSCARSLPLEVFLMAPSCVPATHLETSGAVITPADIARLLRLENCLGLGEMMAYPDVIAGEAKVLKKIALARGKVIDGHAPGLSGQRLNAYISTGIGSDHESVSLGEAAEKLRRGMYIMIREGSTERNLEELLPLVTDGSFPRCLLVTDDRHAGDILHDGDIDGVVRRAIKLGVEPIRAIQMATINPATYFRLRNLGAIAPGYFADIIVLDGLADFKVHAVYYRGMLVAKEGKPLFEPVVAAGRLRHTVNIKPFSVKRLRLKAKKDAMMAVIEVVPGQIITKKKLCQPAVANGFIVSDTGRDILKAVVVERHRASGRRGIGLVSGFGLKKGALGSSIAHDSHNIVVVGVDDADIYTAIKEIERLQGGLVAVADGEVLARLATPIAGLLSPEPLESVVAALERLNEAARFLGCALPSPFSTLSFLALPVIPELRLTDRGLVDVKEFRLLK